MLPSRAAVNLRQKPLELCVGGGEKPGYRPGDRDCKSKSYTSNLLLVVCGPTKPGMYRMSRSVSDRMLVSD